ncbi:MFS transporter protein [Rutstroemia sp. NJR-2017a WRK4]|nr:MFS transporter protein [Rutstroemia sp. NJR-2017a WRK4]
MASRNSFSRCTAGDPKFWPAYVRHSALACVCAMVFLANMFAAGITTGFAELAMEFHVGPSKLVDQIAYPVLALGVGNIIWTPTAICFGKRPTIIAALVLFLAASIWSVEAKTFESLLAARVVASFAGGSIDSLGPAVVADLYMERYFATAMAIFSLCLSGGSQIGPMIAGYTISAKGWRWFFKICAILVGANLVLALFFFPETNYRRIIYEGETALEADKEAEQKIEYKNQDEEMTRQPSQAGNKPYAGSYWMDLWSFGGRGMDDKGLRGWPEQFSLPFRFLAVPHALYATVAYGVFLAGAVATSSVMPQLLSPPPYLFTSSALGLFSLSSFIGIVVAYPIAGPLTDSLSRYFDRRSRDEMHIPENRMPALIMPFLIGPPGLLLFAYIINEQKTVYAAACGYAMQISGLVFVPSVVLSVVVDGWPSTGSEALVLINAGKNLVAFGVVLGISDWLAKEGTVKMFWEIAAIQWAVMALGVPLYFFGPWARRRFAWLV